MNGTVYLVNGSSVVETTTIVGEGDSSYLVENEMGEQFWAWDIENFNSKQYSPSWRRAALKPDLFV